MTKETKQKIEILTEFLEAAGEVSKIKCEPHYRNFGKEEKWNSRPTHFKVFSERTGGYIYFPVELFVSEQDVKAFAQSFANSLSTHISNSLVNVKNITKDLIKKLIEEA